MKWIQLKDGDGVTICFPETEIIQIGIWSRQQVVKVVFRGLTISSMFPMSEENMEELKRKGVVGGGG